MHVFNSCELSSLVMLRARVARSKQLMVMVEMWASVCCLVEEVVTKKERKYVIVVTQLFADQTDELFS